MGAGPEDRRLTGLTEAAAAAPGLTGLTGGKAAAAGLTGLTEGAAAAAGAACGDHHEGDQLLQQEASAYSLEDEVRLLEGLRQLSATQQRRQDDDCTGEEEQQADHDDQQEQGQEKGAADEECVGPEEEQVVGGEEQGEGQGERPDDQCVTDEPEEERQLESAASAEEVGELRPQAAAREQLPLSAGSNSSSMMASLDLPAARPGVSSWLAPASSWLQAAASAVKCVTGLAMSPVKPDLAPAGKMAVAPQEAAPEQAADVAGTEAAGVQAGGAHRPPSVAEMITSPTAGRAAGARSAAAAQPASLDASDSVEEDEQGATKVQGSGGVTEEDEQGASKVQGSGRVTDEDVRMPQGGGFGSQRAASSSTPLGSKAKVASLQHAPLQRRHSEAGASASRRLSSSAQSPTPAAVQSLTPTKATCMGVRLTRAQLLQQEQRRAAAAARGARDAHAAAGGSGAAACGRQKAPRRLTMPGATGPPRGRPAGASRALSQQQPALSQQQPLLSQQQRELSHRVQEDEAGAAPPLERCASVMEVPGASLSSSRRLASEGLAPGVRPYSAAAAPQGRQQQRGSAVAGAGRLAKSHDRWGVAGGGQEGSGRGRGEGGVGGNRYLELLQAQYGECAADEKYAAETVHDVCVCARVIPQW